jgi:NTP pyrophosphatase (non-canonical NTP hydrolase)
VDQLERYHLMDGFATYQIFTKKNRLDQKNPIVYPMIGLTGEVGEVAEKIKKVMRDKDGVFSQEDKDAIKLELGDVLYYLSELARDLDIWFEEVPLANINKIESRAARGKLRGSGDYR